MAQKITCDDLQKLLAGHLKGTAVEPFAENKDYVTGPDGFVAVKTIDNLCNAIEQVIQIQIKPNPFRRPEVRQQMHVTRMRQAIEALQPFREEK